MPSSTDGPFRILIVDDTSSNVRLLEFTLRRGGYEDVASTMDPTKAVAMHVENPFDLILLDLQMPKMSGYEVMKQLRALDGGHRVGILVMSADPAAMVSALEGGANSFLSKPFVLGDVLTRVQTMLEARETNPRTADRGASSDRDLPQREP
jgi:putative two-component system response regulator